MNWKQVTEKAKAVGLGLAALSVPAAAQATTGGIPADIAGISTVAVVVLLIGGYFYMGKRKDMGTIILVVGALMALGVFSLGTPASIVGTQAGTQGSVECGKSATLSWYNYDKTSESGSLAVSPSYYVYDQNGARLLSAVTTNTTTAATCDKLDIYVDDDASWYGTPALDVSVTSERSSINMEAFNVVTETNLNVTLLDSDYNAVTGATGAGNADFNVGLGQGQSRVIYAKLTNLEADARFRLCGASVAYNRIDELKIDDSAWTEVPCWDEVKSTSFIYGNSTNTVADPANRTDLSWDACYKRTTCLDMDEFDETNVKLVMTALSTQNPIVDNATIGAIQFYDAGYALATDGTMKFGTYVQDANERHSEVGMAEDESSPMGATSGCLIEAT